jgi:hypothetical protein
MDASLLTGWENFYVIVGSAAGGLTGLTFVVIALVRDALIQSSPGFRPTGLGAFVTPTIVHFSGLLGLAAFLSMPHQSVLSLSAGFAIAGLAGMSYGGFIAANMRGHGGEYIPVPEDWIWNVILPTLVYGCFMIMAAAIWRRPAQTLYCVAVLCLLLLFIGIRNAWDIAVWMSTHKPGEKN